MKKTLFAFAVVALFATSFSTTLAVTPRDAERIDAAESDCINTGGMWIAYPDGGFDCAYPIGNGDHGIIRNYDSQGSYIGTVIL